jgi:hypothetical protein
MVMALIADVLQSLPLFRQPLLQFLPVFAQLYQKGAASYPETHKVIILTFNCTHLKKTSLMLTASYVKYKHLWRADKKDNDKD